MLPDALISTYEQYKRDTAAVTQWLATTASSLGYNTTTRLASESGDAVITSTAKGEDYQVPEPKGRLKGKARAEAKKKAATVGNIAASSTKSQQQRKYLLGIRDFVPMAQMVVKKNEAAPSYLEPTLDRVIAARSIFRANLSKDGFEVTEDSDKSHEFFVSSKSQYHIS